MPNSAVVEGLPESRDNFLYGVKGVPGGAPANSLALASELSDSQGVIQYAAIDCLRSRIAERPEGIRGQAGGGPCPRLCAVGRPARAARRAR